MPMMQSLAFLAARALIALIFVVMAVRHIRYRGPVQRDMAAHGMPLAGPFLVVAIVVELAGGLALMFGYRTAFAAPILAVYTVAATLVFYRQIGDREQLVHALKNAAIVGGLVLLTAAGAGPLSLDLQGVTGLE
jgi:putative oxidoreductase